MPGESQLTLVGNDGGFGLPEAETYERDDGSIGEIPPDEVFMPPIRARFNGWKKWHARSECGRETVYYVEDPSPMHGTERYDWDLYCFHCDRGVHWDEVLYVSEEWFVDRRDAMGYRENWRMFEKLHLDAEAVVELGADPTESELLSAIDAAWDEAAAARYRLRDAWNQMQDGGGEP